MAKIVLYSMAHRGDVFPYVPVASELSRRGHDVTFVVPNEFHADLAAEPFTCVHSGTDFGPKALDERGAFLARWGMRFAGAMTMRLYFGEFTIPHLDSLFTAIDDALDGADLLFSHPAASIVGALPCERRGIPWMVGDLFPMLLPTADNPPAGLPNLGRRANTAVWRVARSPKVERMTSGRDFKAFRRKLGLPVPEGWNVMDARLSPMANIALASSHYVPTHGDWPAGYRLTGFTPWVGPDHGAVPDDVEAFLAAGDAPILVTLGTSGASSRPEVFEHVAAALDALGERGLFLVSNETVADRLRGISARHGVWPFVPLQPLLGRVKAIVQSGAHGTNALALSAGLPSVVVPCLFDQLWHAQRHEQLGTGVMARKPRDIPRAIARVLTDSGIRGRARELGAAIAAEDGIAAACDEIEAFVNSR